MGIRVLLTLLITFFGVTGSFFNAFYGLIAYAFWSYTYPERVTWGLLPFQGLSYITGLILVWNTIMQKKRLFANNPKNIAIIIFWFLCLMALFPAGLNDYSTWQFKFFTRVILIALIITVLIELVNVMLFFIYNIFTVHKYNTYI